MLRRATLLSGLALLACAIAAPGARAFVAHPDVDYDVDSPPAPAPASQNQLDLYVPDGVTRKDSRPLVVYVHGGAWQVGDKGNQIADKRDLFTGAGYLFASLNYRLSPVDTSTLDPARI